MPDDAAKPVKRTHVSDATLRRLEELTGRDIARPTEAAEVYVALECLRTLGIDT